MQNDLLVSFFFNFSRFEFALKEMSYLKKPKEPPSPPKNRRREDRQRMKGNPIAEVNWETFGREINCKIMPIDQQTDLEKAYMYFKKYPPKKQVVRDGKLSFAPDQYVGKLDMPRLLSLVCRVRNNLFHGAKFTHADNDHPGSQRTIELVQHSLTILKASHAAHREIADTFGTFPFEG